MWAVSFPPLLGNYLYVHKALRVTGFNEYANKKIKYAVCLKSAECIGNVFHTTEYDNVADNFAIENALSYSI